MALARAAELAVLNLPAGHTLLVDGVHASHGAEARGLDNGTHAVLIVDRERRVQFRHVVMLDDDERVVLDPSNMARVETFRGAIPEREEPADPSTMPQSLVVGAVERQAVRIHIDGASLPFDPATRTFQTRLEPGPHTLERYVAGRRRAPFPFEVRGAPWQCAVGRLGDVRCVELPPREDAAPVDVQALRQTLQAMPAERRLAHLDSLAGTVSCQGIAAIATDLLGDDARLEVAVRLRSKVVDPWNHRAIEAVLSFPDAKRMVVALYDGAPEAPP